MCGRYKRRGDKQKIAEAFQVRASLDELYLESSDEFGTHLASLVRPGRGSLNVLSLIT
jgi:hypothetical protein